MKTPLRLGMLIMMSQLFFACERVVDINLPSGAAIPYVDAWITTKPGVQTIRFLKAADYMSNAAPEAISDAQITVTDLTTGTTYPFTYAGGSYTHDPGPNTSMGIEGHSYQLRISYEGEVFEAFNEIRRSAVIDSITYYYQEASNGEEEGYYAKLFARDIPGAPDYYWIRTYRNQQLNYYVGEMLSINGGFSEDIGDGFEFIPPFRDGITSGEKPYVKGDLVTVQIRSLTRETHGFLEQAAEQLTNDGLFGKVLQNVPSNITNTQPSGKLRIYGWFGTVSDTEKSVIIP